MEQIKKLLKERKNQLQELKKDKEKALVKAPEGNLRLCKHGNKTQYYYRNNPKDLKWQLKFKEREVMGYVAKGKDLDDLKAYVGEEKLTKMVEEAREYVRLEEERKKMNEEYRK